MELGYLGSGRIHFSISAYFFMIFTMHAKTRKHGKIHILVGGGIRSFGPHVKNCTVNIDHIRAGRLLSLPSPGRQRPWKVILHIFDPLWLHCSADGVKRATELKSSQTKHVALAFWS